MSGQVIALSKSACTVWEGSVKETQSCFTLFGRPPALLVPLSLLPHSLTQGVVLAVAQHGMLPFHA
jgi:hypothetical protein